mmetsp:Transcript_30467/g.104781  ORF Transcript_30467/g.104781 Transcript_30467/m.104781 type:complete len:310 (-) Transcript_30467:627-1556(-)
MPPAPFFSTKPLPAPPSRSIEPWSRWSRGTSGATSFFARRASQFSSSNQACFWMSRHPPAPQPNLLVGFLTRRERQMPLAAGVRRSPPLRHGVPSRMRSISAGRSFATKGGWPVKISTRRHPKAHQSTEIPYGCRPTISSAKYKGVPQKVPAGCGLACFRRRLRAAAAWAGGVLSADAGSRCGSSRACGLVASGADEGRPPRNKARGDPRLGNAAPAAGTGVSVSSARARREASQVQSALPRAKFRSLRAVNGDLVPLPRVPLSDGDIPASSASSSDSSGIWTFFAKPKSHKTMYPSNPSSTFSGFRSR